MERIVLGLGVAPTVDAFSEEATSRFSRWWGPRSPEAKDAFAQPWGGEVLWANPPFSAYNAILYKLVADGGHAVLIVPEWKTQDFLKKPSLSR